MAAGTAVTDERDERMDGMDVKESHSSSSCGTSSTCLENVVEHQRVHSRSRELGALIYGTEDVFFRRLCEYEQIAAKKEDEYLETRRKELATEPVTPKILPVPAQPSEVERQHHMVNHLPPAPWCELCVMRRGVVICARRENNSL